MTDQRLLALASKVYPDREWLESDTTVFDLVDGIYHGQFDPANNADQFVAVLAWLVFNHAATIGRYWVSLPVFSIEHDGTAAGLRQAVTDAAVRVAAG